MKFSLVIPIFNEENLIKELFERLNSCLNLKTADSEIIVVNDGSTDASLTLLKEQLPSTPGLTILNLSRNFGHQSAIMAGLSETTQNPIIIMDADLQDPPELIPKLIHEWEQGNKIVLANRKSRRDGFLRNHLFSSFYKIFSFLSDLPMPLESGVFGLIDERVKDELLNLEERNRFIPGLRAWVGFKTSVVWYDREPRAKGKPKQTLFSLLKYAFDALFSFSYKPLRLSLFVGVFISFLSFFYGFILIFFRILNINVVQGFTTTTVALFFLGGVLLISNGILGEYLGRIYDEVKKRPLFIISDRFSSNETTKIR